MQQRALAWLSAARAWTNRKRPGIHRLLICTLIAPLVLSVSAPLPAQAATVTASDSTCSQTVNSATGVTVVRSGNDCIVTFAAPSNTTTSNTWTVPSYVTSVQVLVIGGGGSGGTRHAGGGGAGGYVYNSSFSVTSGASLSVTAGAGGASVSGSASNGNSGVNSVFGSITAYGGGFGGQTSAGGSGATVGSAGGSCCVTAAGTSSSGQGNNGGKGTQSNIEAGWSGGGGGGAGGVGGSSTSSSSIDSNNWTAGNAIAGAGGQGSLNSITGASVCYAAGGGGGSGGSGSSVGLGGQCSNGTTVGGAGTTSYTPNAGQGTDNTGSGGGGAGFVGGTNGTSGRGGSGVVIVRYTVPLFTVTFNANSGSGAAASASVSQVVTNAYGAVTLSAQGTLSRVGYTYGGWNTAADGSGTSYSAGASYTPTSNITLYAQWNSTISYNTNGATTNQSVASTTATGSGATTSLSNGLGSGTPVSSGLVLSLDAADATSISGSTWTNKSSSGLASATIVGSPKYDSTDGSFQLNGVDQYFNLGTTDYAYAGTTAFSINVSFNPTDPNTTSCLLGRYNRNVAGSYSMRLNSGGQLGISREVTPWGATSSSNLMQTGNTYYASMTYDGTNLRGYLNGNLVAGPTAFGSVNTVTIATLIGGCQYNSSLELPFKGKIYNAQIYNRALSASEVQTNFQNLLGGRKIGKTNYTLGPWTTAADTGTAYGNPMQFDVSALPAPYFRLNADSYVNNSTPLVPSAGASNLSITTTGTFVAKAAGGKSNGANAQFATIGGTTTAGIRLGNAEVKNYTLCTLARYAPLATGATGSKGRLIANYSATGSNNWFSGWYYGATRQFHHGSWVLMPTDVDDDWHLSCDSGNTIYWDGALQTSGVTPAAYTGLPQLAINWDYYGQNSDWEFAEMIVYDSVLSPTQMDQLSRYFTNRYGLINVNATSVSAAAPSSVTNYASSGNATLYASWQSTVTYDGNDATSGSVPSNQTIWNTAATVAGNTGSLTKTGFIFNGWNTAANGSGTKYAVGAPLINDGNKVLYAQWVLPVNFPIAKINPSSLSPYQRFVASDYDAANKIWKDSSGNGRNAGRVAGTPSVTTTTANTNGATNTFKVVSGGTSDKIWFGNAPITPNWTVFALSRYSGATKARIIGGDSDRTNSNILIGHWAGNAGVTHMNGWIGGSSTPAGITLTNWIMSTVYPSNYRLNGTSMGSSGGTNVLAPIGINTWSTDVSNFEVAEVLIFDRTLTASEINQVEDYFDETYGLAYPKVGSYKASNSIVVANSYGGRTDTFTATDGSGTKTFSVSPTIPGITLDVSVANNVALVVAPTLAVGTYFETITATDNAGNTALFPYQITVANPLVMSASNPSGVLTTYGKATRTRLDFSGGYGTRIAQMSQVSGPSQRGVSIDTSTISSGFITLITDTSTAPGTYLESITVTDASKILRTTLVTITINAPPVIGYSSATDAETPLVTANLYLNYDFANTSSYSGSGTTITDLKGNASAGTISSAAIFGTGSGGNLSLNGTNKATISYPALSNTQTFSKFLWFYPTAATGTILTVCDNAACNNYHESEFEMSSNVLYARVWNAASVNSGSNTVSLNQWHYVGYSWEYVNATTTNLRIYLDGKLVGSAAQANGRGAPGGTQFDVISQGDGTYMATNTNGTFLFGALHMYKSVLTSAQIAQNFQNTKARYLGLSTPAPAYSGNITLNMTEGQGGTYQTFIETGGTGSNTYSLSGSNSQISLTSPSSDRTSLVVSSAITATNSTTARTYYETLTATDSATAATAYYLTINVNPKILVTATTDTVTTTFGKIAYDTITASYGTGTLSFTRTSGSGSSAITSSASGNQSLLTIAGTLPVGTYYETFTVTDTASATTLKVITIVVNPAPTLISATGVNTLETTYTKAASLTINVANGTGTRTASALPVTISGVSLTTTNLQNGTLVLALTTAVAVGTYTETITVTDSASASASIVITIIVNAAPTISYGGSTSGALTFVTTKGGTLQSNAFTALNGTGTRTLSLSGLNSGISIDTSTANSAVLTFGSSLNSMDTQTARTYSETITVTDSLTATATRSLTVIVNPSIIETATSTSIATTSGIETSTVIYATKGSSDKTFSFTSNAPSGITLTSGVNQATLRVLSTINPGTYSVTVTATDTTSATTSLVITIVVSPPPSLTGTSRIETSKGVAFKSPLYAISGGTGTLTMTLTNSPTNSNISLTGTSTSGGYLQVGSASDTGTYTSTIRVTDARGAYSEIAVTVVVNAPVTLSGSLSITKTYGTSTTNGYSTNGTGTAPFSFSATPVCAVVKTVSGAVTYEKVNGTDGCTWTAPVGITTVDALLVGAGGGGGGDGGAGGGGGSINTLTAVALPANRQLAVQVGAGGNGGAWGGPNASNGGTTSVVSGSTTYTAPGGAGGGGCGSAASAGGVTGSGGSPTAGGSGGYGATGTGCSAGTGAVGSNGPASSFTGSSISYGGGGGGGPFPDSTASIGLKTGGSGGGGTGTQASGQSSYGLPTYFRALSGTPSNATAKEAFTTGTCGAVTGNIGYSTDSEFPCSQKDNFQGYATGYFVAPYSGSITFYLTSDDSSDLVININGTNNELQLSDCCRTASTTWSGFTAGQAYPISVYFTEISGLAQWKLDYSYTGVSQTTIPLSQFRSGSYGLATYFRANNSTSALSKNTFTSGTCAQVVGNIDFANDAAFPCDGKDNFQGYATGYFVAPVTGDITFTLSSDDSSDLVINVNGTSNELQLSIGSTSATWSGFVKGQYYPISVFFTEITGAATWKLEYTLNGQAKTVIPTTYLRSNADFISPTAGTNGLGGGGGAGSAGMYKISGAQGGSGTVILKYATLSDTATETMITAYVNQESPSGLLTLNVPAYVPVGTYTETITVQDAANSAPYTATVRITVNKATPTATLSLPGGVTTAKYGTPVTLSASASTPGNIAFKKAGSAINGCSSVATTNGVATCTWTPSVVESTTITALLSPTDSSNYNVSNETVSALSITVGKADTLTITANTPSSITYSASMTMPSNGFTTSGLKSIDTITAVSYSYALTQGATCATGGTCVVGDIGPAGGVVFYVSATRINAANGVSTGGLYLEAAPAPYSATTYNWCEGGANPYTTLIGASGTAVGTGASNTQIMLNRCSGGAARAALAYRVNGIGDWFLPSTDELALMSTYKTQIGLNTSSLYWGSTESSNWVAASLVTSNGGVGGQNKGQATPLWPIHAFSPDVITTPTNAGTYTITPSSPIFSSGAESNYTSILYNTGTLVINKAPRSTWSTTYNGGTNTTRYGVGQTETATVTYPGDGTNSFTTSSSTCSVNLTSGTLTTLGVGSCGIQVVLSQTRNWLSDTKTVTVTINRGLRTATVTPALSTIKYGDTTTVTSTVSPALDSATVSFSSNSSLGCAVDNISGRVTGIKASTACSVRVTYDQTGLYESATATASITINKATAPIVTTDSITAVSYTGITAIVTPTYKVSGILARDISQILPLADVSSTLAISAIAANTYTTAASYRYFATNPTAYDSTTAPTLGGTYAVSAQSLTLLGGLDIGNYETPTYVSSNLVIQPIAQAPLRIQLSYLESVTVPFDVSTTGGSSSGARTLAILSGGTATGCAVDSGVSLMRLKTTTAGTCIIQVTQAADRNYLVAVSDSQTVNILNFVVNILQLFNNPTGIVINRDVPFIKGAEVCTVNCQPTVTQITDVTGADITTMTVGTPFRIIGTNFTTASGVFFTAVIGGSRRTAVPADSFQIDSDTQITVMPPTTFVPNAGETVSSITVRIYVVASGGQNFPNTSIIAISL